MCFFQSLSPEEQFEPQVIQVPIGSPEPSVESTTVVASPRVAPVPKPRTLQPGRAIERRLSSEAQASAEVPAEGDATVPPPLETASLVPKVPPRRKKSAPAAFHLQVLQSNSLLLQDVTCCSGNDNNHASHPRAGDQPASGPPASRADLLSISPRPSQHTDNTKAVKTEAAPLLGEHQDPFLSLLHHPTLLDTGWFTKSSEPLGPVTPDPERESFNPAQVSAPAARVGPSPAPGHKDFERWVMFSEDEDRRTALQLFDPLAKT